MPKTVTIIDDSDADRFLIRSILEDKGCEVREISPFINLFDKLKEDTSDIIILDMFMGVLNAFDVLKRIPSDRVVYIVSGLHGSCYDLIEYGLKDRNIPLLDKGKLEQELDKICQIN